MERVPAAGNSGGRAPTRISGSSERRTTSLHGGPPRRHILVAETGSASGQMAAGKDPPPASTTPPVDATRPDQEAKAYARDSSELLPARPHDHRAPSVQSRGPAES